MSATPIAHNILTLQNIRTLSTDRMKKHQAAIKITLKQIRKPTPGSVGFSGL
jgi:hypothetical protein